MKEFDSILYIEDDPGEAYITERLYRDIQTTFHKEVKFHTTDTWEKGVAYVESLKPDVVILDLALPPNNCDTTLEKFGLVSKDWPPTIVVTGNIADKTLRRRSIEAGADDFMVKPDARHGGFGQLVERVYHCYLRKVRDAKRA